MQWVLGTLISLAIAFLVSYLSEYLANNSKHADSSLKELRVLAYSSFTASWGPGPTIAKMFEAKFPGTKVILLQAEDAGLLLAKLQSFPADVVLGFDQLGKRLAEKKASWQPHQIDSAKSDSSFIAFDWAPLGFIYREGEIVPPKNFEDLLSPRFAGTITLQDPRSSSPGSQFIKWLVLEMGEDKAFEFLKKLKPNVHSMSGSWSQAYGLFTRGLSKLNFGYATSIIYHRVSENDDRYRFAVFPVRHPVQIEYAAIAEKCQNCELAREFLSFLLQTDVQKILMTKNWMLPVDEMAARDTPFADLISEIRGGTGINVREQSDTDETYDPDAVLTRWRKEVL